MTKEAALYEFFNSFGIPGYVNTTVSSAEGTEKTDFPYLTYELVIGSWDDGELSITVNLYYRTESELVINEKAREIEKRLSNGGKQIHCDDGTMWLKKGRPWITGLSDEDPEIKRRYINIDIEFNTSL